MPKTDNLIGQSELGVLIDGKDMAYQNQSSMYVPAVFCDDRHGFEPIRVTKIALHHAPDLMYMYFESVLCVPKM